MTAAIPPVAVDVCLLLEGTYPHTPGGVSSWVHDLIGGLAPLTFHVVSLLPGTTVPPRSHTLPGNVVGLSHVFVRSLPAGPGRVRHADRLFAALAPPMARIQEQGGLRDIAAISRALDSHRRRIGSRVLLDSGAAWDLLQAMYRTAYASNSFLDYFWAWRCLQEGLFSAMLAPLPPARVYHTVSTGFAGLLAARARIETGRPTFVTEHGIYTNERRVEIAMADWLHEAPPEAAVPGTRSGSLADFWIRTFVSYSRACYEACDPIVTLFEGNQPLQAADGAPSERLRVIPNGVDAGRFAGLAGTRRPHPPTIALIGRIVPIKDIKTFLRACSLLRRTVPGLRAWLLGGTGEDPGYAAECRAMVRHLGLEDTVTFHGQVRLDDHLAEIDVVVLTSISESQPLVILEAGAAGVPVVATDVGSCRDLILGHRSESPPLGPGGTVTRLADPAATARGVERLLADPAWRAACGLSLRRRVERHYDKAAIERRYRDLYAELIARPTTPWPSAAEETR